MDLIKTYIAPYLPNGATIGDIYEDRADPNELIIEYSLDDHIHFVSPLRDDIRAWIGYPNTVYRTPALTHNDLYAIVSERHNLALIKGIDYDDNPTQVTESRRYYLPIAKTSLRFTSVDIVVDVVDPGVMIPGNEDQRDLSDHVISMEDDPFFQRLTALRYTFYDVSHITCFDQGRLTVAFRRYLADTVEDDYPEVKKEIMASYIFKAFSDGLSDVLMLIGPSELPYIIRYASAKGDTPK